MKHRIIIILLSILIPLGAIAQDESPEELFGDGDFFYEREDYSDAAHLYRQVLKAEPDNANIKFKLGMAYLNIPGEESRAIPYFLEATENITLKYRKNRYKVKRAPHHTWFFLGNAYRINNELDKALDAYERFRSLKNFEKKYSLRFTEKEIKAVGRAKIIQDAPKDLHKICLEEPLNTSSSEYNAVISANEKVMVWMNSQKFYEAIMMSVREDGVWTRPINITPQVGSDGDMTPTGLSADGTELLLVGTEEYNSDIYYSKFDGTFWSKAELLSGKVNSSFTELHASFSADGEKIYFSSDQRGTYGGMDIFFSYRYNYNKWGVPINMGPLVNTEFDETSAYLSPDGSRLLFASKGHYNMGGYDLFYCEIFENGSLSEAVNMGFPVNTTNNNLYFSPVKDGMSGIYSIRSDEGPGNEDIWYIEIMPHSKHIPKSCVNTLTNK
jgi:tetratricopeptide (TPR) repeat protein